MNRTTAVTLPFVASFAAATLAVGVPVGIAHSQPFHDTAKPAGLTVDQHGRVVLSALDQCANEDSPNPGACTWNVGPQYHVRDGLSLYYRRAAANDRTPDGDFRPHYVWNRDPVQRNPQQRRWLDKSEAKQWPGTIRCWVNYGPTSVIHCPNGHRFTS